MSCYKVAKFSRVLSIACAVAIAFITVFASCVTAFAANPFVPGLLDPEIDFDNVVGAIPISIEEAQEAAFQIYYEQLGIDEDNLRGMLCFVAEKEHYMVAVYDVEYPDEPVDYIMYLDDYNVYSFAFDTSVPVSEKVLTIRQINDGTDLGFKLMTKTSNFFMSNPLCSFILGLSFTFFAFRLFGYGVRSAKTM